MNISFSFVLLPRSQVRILIYRKWAIRRIHALKEAYFEERAVVAQWSNVVDLKAIVPGSGGGHIPKRCAVGTA